MSWFSRKPSPLEHLITLMQAERTASAEVQKAQLAAMERMMAVTEAQSGMLKEWLALFANPPKPEVRVMNDAKEAAFERLSPPDPRTDLIPDTSFDPQRWFRDMTHSFDDLKKELA